MNKLEAALKMKCPKCHEGDLFESKNPYTFGKMTVMHEHCPKCHIKFEREMGFFYGAMYVSYVFNIMFFVMAVASYYLYFETRLDWRIFISCYLLFTLLIFPVMYRLSRSIWIQIFY